jgi:phosphoglycerate dehydrogenase-like enzyme
MTSNARDRHVVLWRNMYDPAGAEQLRAAGCRVTVVESDAEDELIAAIRGAHALWVRYPLKVTARILDAAPLLEIVSSSGFGTDNIDIEAATQRGILVVNQRGFGRIPVSEHAVLLMLALAHRLIWGDAATRDGSGFSRRTEHPTFDLNGKVVGIVGLGYIGSELARKLSVGFGCEVLAYDPYVDPRIPALVGAARVDSLDAMLPRVRFLCLCLELTPETANLIGARELSRLRKDAFVVNVSRGGVLDLDALASALRSEQIAGAGLDVYAPEPPPPDHPVLRLPNVVLTPHTAGVTIETNVRSSRSAVEQLLAGLAGELPAFAKNPAAWDGPRSRRNRCVHA